MAYSGLIDRPRKSRLRAPGRALRFVLALALALGAGTAQAGAGLKVGRDSDQPIRVDAASSEVDYRSNAIEFRDIVITQGLTRVAAARASASGLNFLDSHWTFSGNVRIDVEGGSLDSEKAVVSFLDNRVSKAVITGNPATFEQKLKGDGRLARGRAGQIEYDLRAGTIRLTEDAWLSDERDELTNPLIIYDIAGERVEAQAVPHEEQRVHITIRPKADSQVGRTPASPAPPP
jgi:lipopolysaccharide transport protein LptA